MGVGVATESKRQRVEMCTIHLSERIDGFVMDLTNEDGEAASLAFPAWVVHQLQRLLPYIDAAILQGSSQPGMLVAHAVTDWNVEPSGPGLGVAIHLRSNRQVDAAYLLSPDDATILHHALGEAIAHNEQTLAAKPAGALN